MAQRIAIDCDVCQRNDVVTPGLRLDLGYRLANGAFVWTTIDVCEEHAKPYADLFDAATEAGRPFEGNPVEEITKRASDLPATCPVCGSSHSNRRALMAHVRGSHETTLSALEGETADHACEVCGRAFTTAHGLAVHLSRTNHRHEDAERADR